MTVFEYIDKKAVTDANKKIKRILLDIINTKKGGKGVKVARNLSGRLRNEIDTILIVSKTGIKLNINAVEYYQYLDAGTKRINKPFFYTRELTENREFKNIVSNLILDATTKMILE